MGLVYCFWLQFGKLGIWNYEGVWIEHRRLGSSGGVVDAECII